MPRMRKRDKRQGETCINCGYLSSEVVTTGTVRIKMPNNIVEGWVGLFSSRRTAVVDSNGKILWGGKHGENATFTVDGTTLARI